MKKLLILMLVLGLASFAHATILDDIRLDFDGTTVTVVGLTAGASYINGVGIYDELTQGIVSGPYNDYVAAGGMRDITKWAGYNGVDITIGVDPEGLEPVLADVWFEFGYDGSIGDEFAIYNYAISDLVPAGALNLVPEPMTIALLGLGGLALLRRRK